MMLNFKLLEPENGHSGSNRDGNGPLAAFTEWYNGREYFHLHRMSRHHLTGQWRVGKQCVTCPVEFMPDMLAAIDRWRQMHVTAATPALISLTPYGAAR